MSKQVVVIGAGVIGLSTALCLKRAGHAVTIIARDFPVPFETADPHTLINYASAWAGAHNRWVLPTSMDEQREHGMALATFRHMESTAATHPEAGISFVPGIEYLEDPPALYQQLTDNKAKEFGLPGFRRLADAELPDRVVWGCEYRTWCVNPMVYCAFLLREFCFLGGKTLSMTLQHPHEVAGLEGFANARNIVNCSGTGFGDPAVFPTRGQTCVVANSCPATVTRQNADGTWCFSVPRGFGGGTVIGGTKEPDNWDPNPSLEIRNQLLDAFAATYPAITSDGPFRVLRDIVGRRPTRVGGLRLEREEASVNQSDKAVNKAIIHAYGLGGRGYELSWGVAEAVLALIQ